MEPAGCEASVDFCSKLDPNPHAGPLIYLERNLTHDQNKFSSQSCTKIKIYNLYIIETLILKLISLQSGHVTYIHTLM